MPSEEYLKRKAAYCGRYQREHYKLVAIKCRKDTDQDILETLKNSSNASEYCKAAIRFYTEYVNRKD